MPLLDLLLVCLTNLAWSFNFVAAKAGLAHFPPFLFTALRFLLVLAFLLPLLRWRPVLLKQLLLVGLFMGALHYGFMFWGMALSADISSVAIAVQLYVPFSTLLAVLFLGERIGWRRSLGISVAFVGVMLIGFDPAVFANLASLVLVTLAALSMAIANIFIRQLGGQIQPLALQAWIAAIAVPPMLILSMLFEAEQWRIIISADVWAWGSIAYSTLGATILGHGVLAYLLSRYPVSTVAPLMLPTPLLAVLFGVTLWGDRLTPELIIGGTLTLAGVAIIALRSRRQSTIVQDEKLNASAPAKP